MTILIINPANDFHCLHMIKRMKERSIPFIELGSPNQNDYSFIDDQLIYNNVSVTRFNAIFYRNNSIFTPTSLSDTYIYSFNKIRLLEANLDNVNSWISIISEKGGKVINPPIVRSKFLQIRNLLREGIPIPQTCITNSPKVIKEFVKRVKKVVYKPLSGGFYCRRVNQEFLDSIHTFIREPAIYQEEIIGSDIRVNLLNRKILSAHLIKKKNVDTLDYRMDSDYKSGNTNYKQIDLPPYVVEFCIKAADILNLVFTGIDLRVDSDGKYYLIECNSMPAYLDIELETGTPITDYIIDYLYKGNNIDTFNLQKDEWLTNPNESRDRQYLFDYKEVLVDYIKNKERIIRIPLNDNQKKFFYSSKITNPQSIIVKVDDTGCQLIDIE
ncbi:ATP-grasp domain-containing protein [Priestia endophytica]|uniref:ATP-grasp domain-containing protein n=1 Tax=Priestia endophytica TaxID=135735 RepID=UPI00124CF67F|nr:ATP-grasp domain-containing protein [Priestia endophytica]KAB2489465.1 ATP-grasp domain-containing protein [Priestia endophytica]